MAINRNIIEWSLTEKAFKAKSYVEIFNMLLENKRAIYGRDIDLTVETALGEELRMESEQLYDFAKIAEDVYYTLDINNAKGALLDNLVSFTANLIRKTNVQTILNARLKFAGENVVVTGSNIYVQDNNDLLWRVQSNQETLLADEWNEVELLCISYGENLIDGENSVVLMTVNNNFWTGDLQIETIIYSQIGSIEETDEMLRARKNNTLSYNSKTLLDSARDATLKNIFSIRDVLIYNADGRQTPNSNIDADRNTVISLLSSSGVKETVILKHDIFVIVQPQIGLELRSFIDGGDITRLSYSIAEIIKQKMTPGVATTFQLIERVNTGTLESPVWTYTPYIDERYVEVKITETVGSYLVEETYRFYVANRYSPKIKIQILTRSNYVAETSENRIRNAVYDLSARSTLNKDIDLAELLTVVMNSNLDVLNPSFVPVGIEVGDITSSDIKVNNGYWLVDKTIKDVPGVSSKWDIEIEVIN